MNPGLVGEKRERYLCAMQPPTQMCLRNRVTTGIFQSSLVLLLQDDHKLLSVAEGVEQVAVVDDGEHVEAERG